MYQDKTGTSLRILVSGFEPFGGESINPTAELVGRIHRSEFQTRPEISVGAVLLPVTFSGAFEKLRAALESYRPDVILAFGQAGGRARIEFERFALNLMDADIPDNEGFQPRDVEIEPSGPLARPTTLPIRQLLHALSASGIPAGLSSSAGLYVCNDLFYRMQKTLQDRPHILSGFIHVPYLPEQVIGKSSAANGAAVPSLSMDELIRAFEVVLNEIYQIPFSHR